MTKFEKGIEICTKLSYDMAMKIKCRILSVFVVAICGIVAIICLTVIKNKKDKEPVYAESINFVGIVGGVELYIYNELVIDENLVKVAPKNCTFKPEFQIKHSSDEEYVSINTGRYSFDKEGKYILSCKVPKNKSYYLKDSISITVVAIADTTTNMYIKQIGNTKLYVDDTIKLDSVVEIVKPINSSVNFECSSNISLNNGTITALSEGYASIEITIQIDDIKIRKAVPIIIKAKVIESDIKLKLSINGNVINGNNIELEKSKFDYSITYELINIDKQLINCWTDSDIIEIISYNPMTIEIKTLNVGVVNIYVSPIDYPDTVLQFLVNIV